MYRFEFMNWQAQTVTVTIGCPAENDGEMRLESDPVVLTEDKSSDVLEPVRCWSGYINIANCTPEVAIMLTSEPWEVEVRTGPNLTFYGYVRCESFTSALLDLPMSLQLPVECPLSKLKRMDFEAKVEETTLLDLAREVVLDVLPDAQIYVEPLNDGYQPSQYRLNKGIFCTWSEADLRLYTSMSLYEVLQACLLPIGYVARIQGKSVTMRRYGHGQAVMLESVADSFYGTGHTFTIERPAKRVMVKATGNDLDMPSFRLEDAKVGTVVSSIFVAGGKWRESVAYNNAEPLHNLDTFRQNSRPAYNLVLLYRNSKTWVGGGVMTDEKEWGEFEQGYDVEPKRALILTRSMTVMKGVPVDMNAALAHFRTTVPLTFDTAIYLKGDVTGMTEGMMNDYKWGNNCAGSLLCKIKLRDKWLSLDATNTRLVWVNDESVVYVPIGEDGASVAENDKVGFLGRTRDGFVIPVQSFPDMSAITSATQLYVDVQVMGFWPIDNNTIYCKVENLAIETNDAVTNDDYKSHEEKVSDAGESDYMMDLDAVSAYPGSLWGLRLGLASVPVFDMAKARMNHPQLHLNLEMMGGHFSPALNYMYGGREMAVMARELHVRDNRMKVELMEVGMASAEMIATARGMTVDEALNLWGNQEERWLKEPAAELPGTVAG